MPIKQPSSNLISITDLFKNSWKFFKENYKKLILITLAALVPIIVLQAAAKALLSQGSLQIEENMGAIAATALILFLISIVIALLSIIQQIALIYFADQKNIARESSVKECYQTSKSYFLSYLWISAIILLIMLIGALGIMFTIGLSAIFKTVFASKYILLALISLSFIAAMLIFFYLLYLSVCFMFSYFILISENIKGWEAIKKSGALVRGRWWNTVFKLIILNLIIFAISLITVLIKMIPQKTISGALGTLFTLIFSLAAIPFTAVYFYFIYKSLS